ncbi:sensor histidine kinase [Chitinophaga japonensis]|uniref:histidine kinase n=1 Tax=Chitinophaga japonensis TaxID=104662 RepID=A0A562T4R2_CHIJA|nr:ATP-binding protein [Chitinophaga japonensis]TWI88268.1 signal transduction histidine kinase [Chitinophaga japonensis]
MSVRLYLLVILLSFVHAAFAVADTPRYALQHFTDENGLPQNSVKSIAPDSAGFIWLATENGLVCYEGHGSFRSFGKNELGITTSRVSYFFPGAGDNGLFARMDFQEVIRISNGKAWLFEKKAFAADSYEYLAYRSATDTYPIIGLPNVFAHDIEQEVKRYMIPTTGSSCFLISRDSITFVRDHRKIYGLQYPVRSFWKFFTLDSRLYHLDEGGRFVVFNRDTVEPVTLSGDILQAPGYRSRKEQIKLYWNFAAGQLFIYLDSACYALQPLRHNWLSTRLVARNLDFESNRVVSVYYDAPHERLFVGSSTRGLFVFTRQRFHTQHSGLPQEDEVYYGQALRGADTVVTPQGAVFTAGGSAGLLPLIREKNTARDKYSMVIDRQGYIWHKHRKTLRKFNSTGTKLLWQWQAPRHINLVYTGAADRLWVGTRFDGLYCLSATDTDPVVSRVTSRPLNISWIQEETPGLVWIGSEEGLYRLHVASGRMDTIPGLTDKYIRSLDLSHPGEAWITTYDDGFMLYRNEVLTTFPLDRNKYLATAHCMVEDNKGYYWITTNRGLFQASRRDLLAYANKEQDYVYYQYYGKDKGFNTNEFNGGCQPCAVKLGDGRISLPSLDGLVFFDPAGVRPDLPGNGLYIGAAMLNGQPVACGDTLQLPHAFRQLQLHLDIPYFGDPRNLQVSYALVRKGQDTVWSPVGEDCTLSFPTLSAGTYSLLVRKINGFGKNNYTRQRLLLIVQPAYYEAWWFRLLVLLLLEAAVIIYSWLRTRRIKKRNQLLESRVADRTAELQSAMSSLSHSEKKLRLQTLTQERLIAAITHDIKTPLKYLVQLAGNMSWKDPQELEPEVTRRSAKAIYDASYRMYYLIENLIRYMRTHVRNGARADEAFDLHELLEEKLDIFNSIAEANDTRIVNNVLPDLQLVGNYQVLAVVLHNLLDNAVKHTRDGVIQLSAARNNGKVAVSVEDTGPGLPLPLLHWINSYHYITGQPEEALPPHSGMGLIIVLELLELVNGRLKAENKPGKGAVISIELKAV